ncbi:hypothetical protein CC86DRAFT_359293 [Ophiobolus disseminans]|uniref:Rhodopsin domain-containing protein n=1 Tax=Ophiobolus disseminans TaxID=1469910 RepID=A0A6A6ZK31_9PLEO|nr:hypothetical protein CC86DRAFT_359293 [Ophiobolus disseminans]
MSAALTAAANKIFANKWHSSDPGGSEAMTIRMVISFAIVAIRIYCKIAKGTAKPAIRRLALDDIFILLALVSSTIGQGVVFWGLTKGGSGMQSPILVKSGRYAGVTDFLIANFIGGMTDYITLTLIRLSILQFYRTIFGVHDRFRKAALWLAGITIVWTLACVLGHIFMCAPVDHLWHPLNPGKCGKFPLFYVIMGSFETAMDTVILVLPIRPIMQLMLPLRTRLVVLGIFLLGSFVIVSNVLRMYFMYQPHTHYIDLQKATLWISVHITSAFACACLPLCKTFVIKFYHLKDTVSHYARSLRGSRSDAGSSRISEKKSSRDRGDSSDGSMQDFRNDGTKNSCTVSAGQSANGQKTEWIPKVIKVDNEFEVV